MEATRGREYRRFLTRLKSARREAGLTQLEAARLLKTSQAFVSKSESGDRRVDVGELKRFARLYHKPPVYFLE